MFEKSVITSFLLLTIAGCLKVSALGMKLLMLVAAGLVGMYMMHLLAQDYNKFQALNRPGRSLHEIIKRSPAESSQDLPFQLFKLRNSSFASEVWNEFKANQPPFRLNEFITLEKIIQYDPTGCARKYVCTISAKNSRKRSTNEKTIIEMLRSLTSSDKIEAGQEAFRIALNLGRLRRNAEACAREYPRCVFNIPMMLKLVGIS